MSRFPAIPESELTDAQKRVTEGASAIFSRLPTQLVWKNDAGQILGPYSLLPYTEDISEPWFQLAFALNRQERLTPKEKELCILAMLTQYDAPFLLYAHSEIALAVGFTKEQVQDALHAKLPEGLNERERTVYNLAVKLAKLHHQLDDETFEQAKVVLGRDGVAGVAHFVAGYVYVSILVNVSDGEVPEKTEGMFLATKNPALQKK